MIIFLAIIKFLSLFVGIWLTNMNLIHLFYRISLSRLDILIQSAAITLFIWLQWLS